MDFEPCFKVHNLVSGYPKGMKLGQMTNLNGIVHVVVSVYRLVTISNSPQFPVEFRNGPCNCYEVNVSKFIVTSHLCVTDLSPIKVLMRPSLR